MIAGQFDRVSLLNDGDYLTINCFIKAYAWWAKVYKYIHVFHET